MQFVREWLKKTLGSPADSAENGAAPSDEGTQHWSAPSGAAAVKPPDANAARDRLGQTFLDDKESPPPSGPAPDSQEMMRLVEDSAEETPDRARLKRCDIGGAGQEIILDAITHLGRSSEVKDHQIRATPESLHDARLAIYIDPPDRAYPLISRNHSLIYPPDDDMGRFSILDLNSLNGTRVNGHKIPANQRIPLSPGMNISLGDTSFDFDHVRYGERLHYGLMVGHHGGNLRGIGNDLEKLRQEFEKRTFTIEVLVNKRATRDLLTARLDTLKRYLTEDSIFLFFFAGHGEPDGTLRLSGQDQDATGFHLRELFEALMDFRGRKLVILDGCHTAEQDTLELPPRTVVIGSRGLAYEGRIDTMSKIHALDPDASQPPFEPPVMGFCSRAIYRFLKEHPQRIDINGLVNYVRKDPRMVAREQRVEHFGTASIVLPTQIVDLEIVKQLKKASSSGDS